MCAWSRTALAARIAATPIPHPLTKPMISVDNSWIGNQLQLGAR
jgi:hypothetical protein